MTPKQLRGQADELFSKRSNLMLTWQEIAENFYPERADFTLRRTIGNTFAENLSTSYPVICRRELGDQIGVMLRPTAKTWAHMMPRDTRLDNDHEAKQWMEWAEGVQRRAMYDPKALFTRATKQGDHDFAGFGQTVISVQLNRHRENMLYRCYHLRDVVWMEDSDGNICFVARKWKPGAYDLMKLFPGKVHQHVIDKAEKSPFAECEVMHIVCSAEMYDGDSKGKPRRAFYYDCDNDCVIEDVAIYGRIYVIPRWETVSGSQYAYSPATVAALPDARLLQSMTYTLLEAGEKATTPPMLATTGAVKSDMAVYAGGVTWIDAEYDERMGEALRTLSQDYRGLPFGHELLNDTRSMLSQAFYLNKLKAFNPSTDPAMTAFQAGQLVQEYIRGALPLFEPMEMDYNGAICEETFEVLQRAFAFGPPEDMPKSLRSQEISWRFESPLHDAIDSQKGQKFLEMKSLIAEAVAMDPNAAAVPDTIVALRDALDGIKVPAKWTNSETTVQDIKRANEAAQNAQQILGAQEQSSVISKNLGSARKDMATASATAG